MGALFQPSLPLSREERLARQKIVVSYGGGVNSVAVLVQLSRLGLTPTAIVMADPGSERAGTIDYRDRILPLWLAAHGFPPVTVITRIGEGADNPRAWRLETLRDECLRINSLPSVAYGFKKCSAKYKGDPQRWWIERQPWAHEEWAQGHKLAKVIGYDFDEPKRIRHEFGNEKENGKFEAWYPLFDAKMDREACVDLIASEGLPVPPKSSCTFCPNNTLAEWEALRTDEPEAFAEAVDMSRRALPTIDSPDVVGLMRCHPHGKRQLHVWADGGYEPAKEVETMQPCECAL